MSNADRVVNLLDRCLRYVSDDASRKLYGKTALKYREVVDRINLLADVTESLMSSDRSVTSSLVPSSCCEQQTFASNVSGTCGSERHDRSFTFERSDVRTARHTYRGSQVSEFYKVLKTMPRVQGCDVGTLMIANSVIPWFEYRYVKVKAPINDNGRPCYQLYHFPLYLAYFTAVACSIWQKDKFNDLSGYFDEFVELVKSSDRVVVPAPTSLLQRNPDHVVVSQEDAVRGFEYWLCFVKTFNDVSYTLKCGVRLYNDQYTAKMRVLGFIPDEVLVKLQDVTYESFYGECG